eukprot:856133-Pyramimonas_sp.AAC.1
MRRATVTGDERKQDAASLPPLALGGSVVVWLPPVPPRCRLVAAPRGGWVAPPRIRFAVMDALTRGCGGLKLWVSSLARPLRGGGMLRPHCQRERPPPAKATPCQPPPGFGKIPYVPPLGRHVPPPAKALRPRPPPKPPPESIVVIAAQTAKAVATPKAPVQAKPEGPEVGHGDAAAEKAAEEPDERSAKRQRLEPLQEADADGSTGVDWVQQPLG